MADRFKDKEYILSIQTSYLNAYIITRLKYNFLSRVYF